MLLNFSTLVIIFVFVLFSSTMAQWISNPEKNTLLVTNCFNPINITSVGDLKGGLFIFWEDNLTGFQSNISFLHVNGDGIVSFRSDGKKISESGAAKTNPVVTQALPNSSYVIWKEKSNTTEQIKAQRVSSNGSLLWNAFGVQVSEAVDMPGDYSVSSDKSGKMFAGYTLRESDVKGDYPVKIQGFTSEGKKIFNKTVTAAVSKNKKSNISCIADGSGGVSVFWIETVNNKSVLMGQNINAAGNQTWGKQPLVISNSSENVFSFSADNFSSSFYIVWQSQKTDKDIFHQLISKGGKILWQRNGNLAAFHKGNQTNPQFLINDNEIILTWTDDNKGHRDILMQKFKSNGEKIWRHDIPVINLKGDQFSQKILNDGKKGALISWIDRRKASSRGNIYAQRFSYNGKPAWDSLGVKVAGNDNTEKSYISVIPDLTGGAVVVFKEKRNNKNEIFGQKIFNTGTFSSQIIAFNTELVGDSVKVSWYSANEISASTFSIERTELSDTAESAWLKIGLLESDGKAAAKYYEYYDKPDVKGTLYYRVVHSDNSGNIQPSDLAKINYLGSDIQFFVSQNSPNPFKDKTILTVYLPEASKVKIEFFDNQIRKISEIEKDLSAGQNDIEFAAGGLQPGIYFYKVHVDDLVDVKKMVIAN